jgi:branched-chain amino acid aminotransferase
MINFNGKCFSGFQSVPEALLCHLTSLPILTHHLLAFQGKISLLEAHYFSIMAALRRSRVEIPMHYTLTFFQEQMDLLSEVNNSREAVQQLSLKFYRDQKPTFDTAITSLCFVMHTDPISLNHKDLDLTLYKDHYVFANEYSNLFQTNESLRKLGQVFAYENGFGAALLLNDHKRLAESTHGTVFLISEGKIQTPALAEGTVNSVLRKAFLDQLKKESEREVIETEIPIFSIQQAEEMFVLSSEYGWVQIRQFRKKKFEMDQSKSIQQKFLEYLSGQL